MNPYMGIATPLAFLKSKKSAGIGEFLDLLPLLLLCKEVGWQVVQLLPLTDSGRDPSPYIAYSSQALNPTHLSLHALPYWKGDGELYQIMQDLNQWETTEYVSYFEVRRQKMMFLRLYDKRNFVRFQKGFATWKKENGWVEEYGLFCALKINFEKKAWWHWPSPYNTPDSEDVRRWSGIFREEIRFYSFVQYLCWKQLEQVARAYREQGVLLKGDLPFLVSRDSVDVWMNQTSFLQRGTMGAPPDSFSKEGQNWDAPIYRWDVVEGENFTLWEKRLSLMGRIFDLYRIDHAIGFFRMWDVESQSYVPSDPSLWIPKGRERMKQMLEISPMLPIAEDLGVTPRGMRLCLKQLGICGTRVIRYQRPSAPYPPLSLTTLATHDMPPTATWWKQSHRRAQYKAARMGWSYDPHLSTQHMKALLKESHSTGSCFCINLFIEYLSLKREALYPSVDRWVINVPGKILPTNWTMRMCVTCESLLDDSAWIEQVRQLY